MALDSVKTKLHEARSALSEMRDEEQKAAGESRYDHRLNAFLSAARSVDYRLRCECPNTYPDWRKQWNAQHPAEDSLVVFINSKRTDDVHKRGSGRTAKTEEIKVGTGSSYSDGRESPELGIAQCSDGDRHQCHHFQASIFLRRPARDRGVRARFGKP
jgi:hypothetical protein